MDAEVTKEMIVKSLSELVKLHPLNKITIGELTEMARISRQTFYYHFKDLFEVYKYAVESKLQTPAQDTLPSLLDAMLDWMQAFEKLKLLSTAFIASKYQQQLVRYLDMINRKTVSMFLDKNPDLNIGPDAHNLTTDFLTYAINGTMIDWIRNGMEKTATEVCNSIICLITAGLSDISYTAMAKNWTLIKQKNGGLPIER